jgi:endonuclease/exonuclease/phosphatase family metal-dependent hydrolase
VRLLTEGFTDVLGRSVRDAGQDVATYPAARPRERIDFLFVGGGAFSQSALTVDGNGVRRASDHLPVVAVVQVRT